jgi:hypothetical protein
MQTTRLMSVFTLAAFLLGLVLGGISLHIVSAQNLPGMQSSVTQIGTALVEMQKNVDALQKNMNTIKQAKDQLTTLSSTGSTVTDAMKRMR